MTEKKHTTVLSLRVKPELKIRLESLQYILGVESKADLLERLLDHFEDPSKTRERIVEREIEKPVIIERPLNDNEVIVRLNTVQFKALSHVLNQRDFIPRENRKNSRAMKEKAFMSEKLKYPGYFVQYDQSGDLKQNIGLLLANTFMSAVAKGMFGEGTAVLVRKKGMKEIA